LKIMRRLLVAGIAALAVVLGLCVSTGTAFAGPFGPHDPNGGNGNGGIATTDTTSTRSGNIVTCTGAVGTCTTTFNNGRTDTCTVPTGGTNCTETLGGNLGRNVGGLLGGVGDGVRGVLGGDNHVCPLNDNRCGPGPIRGGNGHGFGFPIGGFGGLPGLQGNLLNLSLLGLNDGGQVSVCTYPTWDSFNSFGNGRFGGRFGGVRGHFGGSLDRQRAAWEQLRAEAACNAAVVNGLNGLSLVDGSYLNFGGQFGTVNVCSFRDFNDFSGRFGGRFGSRFNTLRGRFGGNPLGAWSQLRNQASCGSTIVVVPSSTTVVQAAPTTVEAAPADPSTSGDAGAGNPQPLASSPLPAIAPTKPPNEGGVDLAYVLAHARVA
jgi:hypothetical protein